MPLPIILGVAAAIAAAGGVGSGIHGAVKIKDANDTMDLAKSIQQRAVNSYNRASKDTGNRMDSLAKRELNILKTFDDFSDAIEKIQNRPEFVGYRKSDVELPKYSAEELKKVAVGAETVLGAAGGAAVGTLGGVAAGGATTVAVMALGTASTGTAISALSGAAATNATLAALGGGALAAGGGGMALGTAVLGGATLGVGLLVGGIIFNATGSKLSDKADEAYYQAKRTEEETNKIIAYLSKLDETATHYDITLANVENRYRPLLHFLEDSVNEEHKTDWSMYSEEEQLKIQNLCLLVGLLFRMCKVNLVIQTNDKNGINKVNEPEVNKAISDAKNIMDHLDAA
jgi:hypothetical protein